MNEIEQVELVCEETNGLAVGSAIKDALVLDLKPIADRLAGYQAVAASAICINEDDAKTLADVEAGIDADLKAVKDCEVLGKITDGLHKLHRRWTALRSLFTDPLAASKKKIHGEIVAWQQEQIRLAEEKQRKLQAEADERARKEQARLEAQAAKLKTPEKREAKLAEAAAVIAPTITVTAPKVVSTRKVWKVKSMDLGVFLAAAASDPSLRGYVSIETTRLERSKAANPALEVPGIVFEHRVT